MSLTHTGTGTDPVASPWGDGSTWDDHMVDDGFSYPSSVFSADVDGDGDVDVLGAAGSTDGVSWWDNLSGDGSRWIERTVSSESASSVYAADLDGDGDVDILGAAYSTGEISWWENLARDGSQWRQHLVVEVFSGAESVHAEDVDGDGDVDVLGAANWDKEIAWWENASGDGSTWVEHTVDESFNGAASVYTADMDGDGDPDVLGAARHADTIAWWQNLSGDGSTWVEHTVDASFSFADSVYAADVDGDVDVDVLGASGGGDGVSWWENNVDNTWLEHVVAGSFAGGESVSAADLDGDGDVDVLGAAYGADAITWWENVAGDGASWIEHTVAGSFDGAVAVHAADVDSDGDVDVLGAADLANAITWWANVYLGGVCQEGQYQAGERISLTADPEPGWGVAGWTGTEDDTSTSTENLVVMPEAAHEASVHYLEGCFTLTFVHLGMGTDPVAVPPQSEDCAPGSYVVGEAIELLVTPDLGWQVSGWLGTEDDTSLSIANSLVMPAADHRAGVEYSASCYRLALGHRGGGEDPTAAPANSPGCELGEFWLGEVVTLTAVPAPGMEVARWFGTDDDIGRSEVNTVTMPAKVHRAAALYFEECFALTLTHTGMGEDPVASPWGDGSIWVEHAVGEEFDGAVFVHSADVDGDGDVDVLGTALHADDITWWENLSGDGSTWAEHVLNGEFDGADSVYAADVDGDGDVDVLGNARYADDITWWENLSGNGSTWVEHTIDEEFWSPESVHAADLDGDGDVDVLGASYGDKVSWWENVSGDGSTWTEHAVDSDFGGALSVYAADVDDDGDADVLGAALLADDITWWENFSGNGSVWVDYTVDGSFLRAASIHAADVDGDGDVDVLGAAASGNDITWWENVDGDGSAWVEHTVANEFNNAYSVYATDVDRDGDIDVLGAASAANDITWWENLSGDGVTWVEHTIEGNFRGAYSVHGADLDGDGDPDVLGAALNEDAITWWENTLKSSSECVPGEYRAGDRIGLIADPDPGWGVGSWTGTEDDTSTSTDNSVLMPAADHEASVHYLDGCFSLTLNHLGMGTNPVATPVASDNCPNGTYVVGEQIQLVAIPDQGWHVAAWLGTDDDTSMETDNSLTMPAADHMIQVEYSQGCFRLLLAHIGEGTIPVAEPVSSPGCSAGEYLFGDVVTLTAAPDSGWLIGRWLGTDDDASKSKVNTITMPAQEHQSAVLYAKECRSLTLAHAGLGANPVADPLSSPGCTEGEYLLGEVVTLTAGPDAGWEVGGWMGTSDDSSRSEVNTLIMPVLEHEVAVLYIENCFALTVTHTGMGVNPATSPLGDGNNLVEQIVDGSFRGADSVFATDLDGDGDVDVLGASKNSAGVSWWENLASDASIWTKHTVDGDFDFATSVYAADLDGDGDVDIVAGASSANNDQIDWWENVDGDGLLWVEHTVVVNFRTDSVYVADLDGDGDMDVLGATSQFDTIKWWENLSGNGTAWTERTVNTHFQGVASVSAADVDGDGDVDVLGAANVDDEITWWENTLGGGTAWVEHTVTGSFDGAHSVHSADVDGDGDGDLVGAAREANQITWWENLSGDGSNWAEHNVDADFVFPTSVYAADLDADGDVDVVGAARNGDEITWWENFASDGLTWVEHAVVRNFDAADAVFAADVDGDGDADILGASNGDDEITWWVNTLQSELQCISGEYQAADRIGLTADPDPGWSVDSWTGTEDDDSTSVQNLVIMPPEEHETAVHYVEGSEGSPNP